MAKNFETKLVIGGKLNPSLVSSFNNASRIASRTSGRISKLGVFAGKAVKSMAIAAGAATIAVAAASVKMAGNFLENADSLEKMRAQTGLTYDHLQKLKYIGGQLSVGMESITLAATAMNKTMSSAKKGTGDAAAAYAKLGVKVKDTTGALRPQSAVFNESLTALASMKNASERNALAFKVFGKGAKDLIPIFDAGPDKIKQFAQEAEKLGFVMSDKDVIAGDDLGDTLEKLKNVAAGVGNKLISKFVPQLQTVADNLLLNSPQIIDNISNLAEKIGGFLEDAFTRAQPAIKWLSDTGLPAAYDILAKVKDGAFAVADFITNNWPIIEPTILGIVTAMAAWKAITIGMLIYEGIMAGIKAGTVAAALAQWGFNAALLANPITWVVVGAAAAVGVLVAGIYALWKNWDKVAASAKNLWKGVKGAFASGVNWVIDKINSLIEKINLIPGINIPLFSKIKTVTVEKAGGGRGFTEYAMGGIASVPSIFGEKGPEIAIPLKRTPRSMGLLKQATRILGGGGGNSIQIIYSPQVSGNNRPEIEQALKVNFEMFRAWLEQYFADKEALSFGSII